MSYDWTVWILIDLYSQSLSFFRFKKHCSTVQLASTIFKFIIYFILQVVWRSNLDNEIISATKKHFKIKFGTQLVSRFSLFYKNWIKVVISFWKTSDNIQIVPAIRQIKIGVSPNATYIFWFVSLRYIR